MIHLYWKGYTCNFEACYPWKPLQGINCGLAPNSQNCPAGYMCKTDGDGTHDKAGQCCPGKKYEVLSFLIDMLF